MILTLQAFRGNAPMQIVREGKSLSINGTVYDFSALDDGDTCPYSELESEHITSDVQCIDGKLCMTIQIPHGPYAGHEARFPDPIIDPPDGPIALPDPGFSEA